MKLTTALSIAGALALAGCSSRVTVAPAGTIVDNFFVTWEVRSSTFGPIDCASANAPGVDMDAVNVDTGERQVFAFPCGAYQGTSGAVGVGHFDILLNLVDPSGGVISQVNVGVQNITTAGTIDLGHILFSVP